MLFVNTRALCVVRWSTTSRRHNQRARQRRVHDGNAKLVSSYQNIFCIFQRLSMITKLGLDNTVARSKLSQVDGGGTTWRETCANLLTNHHSESFSLKLIPARFMHCL